MKFFKWNAGILEDKTGTVSSKRLTLLIFTYIFWMEVYANIEGEKIDSQLIYTTVVLTLFCIGTITIEYFREIKAKIKSTV